MTTTILYLKMLFCKFCWRLAEIQWCFKSFEAVAATLQGMFLNFLYLLFGVYAFILKWTDFMSRHLGLNWVFQSPGKLWFWKVSSSRFKTRSLFSLVLLGCDALHIASKKETSNQSNSCNRQFIVREFVLYKEGSYIECIWSIIEMIDQVHKKQRFQRLLNCQFVFLFLQSYTTRESRRLFGKHRSLSSEWCHPFPRLCHVLCTILLRLRWSGTALPRFVADIFSPKGVVNSQDTTDWLQTTTNTAEAGRSLN